MLFKFAVGRSVKFLLAFASTVIRYFSLLEIHDKDSYSLLYDWQFTANQFVLAPNPLKFRTRDFFFLPELLLS
jgi:hypothetical protein